MRSRPCGAGCGPGGFFQGPAMGIPSQNSPKRSGSSYSPLWHPPPERWLKIPTLQIAAKVKLRQVDDLAAGARREGRQSGGSGIRQEAHGSVGEQPVTAAGMEAPEVVARTGVLQLIRHERIRSWRTGKVPGDGFADAQVGIRHAPAAP